MATKSKMVKKLEADRKLLYERVNAINELLNAERERIEMPKLVEKYEGKHFKFRNGVGGSAMWDIYVRCDKVLSLGKFLVTSFEVDSLGNCEFCGRKESFDSFLFETPVSKKEFDAELKKFKSRLGKM